jgi:hypothetical protein
MARPDVVWVMADPADELDRALVEALKSALGGKAEVEARPRASGGEPGVVGVLRSVVAELGGRRAATSTLGEELERAQEPPAAIVSAWVDDLEALVDVARRGGPRPARVAVVRTPALGPRWLRVAADVFAVADEHAAKSCGERRAGVRVTGVPVGGAYGPVGDAPAERQRRGFAADAHVVLITADAFEPHELGQLLIQLGLVHTALEVVFEVDDAAVAAELRRLAPAHGLSTWLIPAGEAGADLWPLAHLVIGQARPRELSRARAAHAPFLAAPPRLEGDREAAAALAASGAGRAAETLATLAVDLDLTLEPERYEALADQARALAVDDPAPRLAAAVEAAIAGVRDRTGAGAGLPEGLERIGGPGGAGPQVGPERFDAAARAAREVRDRSELWSQRAQLARSHGDQELALEADKRAARHREVLGRMLEAMRPPDWAPEPDDGDEPDLDEELDALRRSAVPPVPIEERLRSLGVEDELRELKKRLQEE